MKGTATANESAAHCHRRRSGLGGSATVCRTSVLHACVGVLSLRTRGAARSACRSIARIPASAAPPSRSPPCGDDTAAVARHDRRESRRSRCPVIGSPEAPYVRNSRHSLDRRDLLLVDPRGTGRSGVIACKTWRTSFAYATGEQGSWPHRSCGRELGARAACTAAAVADDIEACARCAGLQRLDPLGDHGTFLMPRVCPTPPRARPLDRPERRARSPSIRGATASPQRSGEFASPCACTRACNGDAVLRDVERLATRPQPAGLLHARRAGDRVRTRPRRGALAELVFTRRGCGRLRPDSRRCRERACRRLTPRSSDCCRTGRSRTPSASATSFLSYAQNLATNCHDYPRSYADAPQQARIRQGAKGDRPARVLALLAERLDADEPRGRTVPRLAERPSARSLAHRQLAARRSGASCRRTRRQHAELRRAAGRRPFAHTTFVEIPNAGQRLQRIAPAP
jgi:hypothetical protein